MNDKQKRIEVLYNGINGTLSAFSNLAEAAEELERLKDLAIRLLADEPEKEIKDYTLNELRDLVHDMAVEKGWWVGERPDAEVKALIHSEISEALECYRNGELAMRLDLVTGKPEGFVVELADALIRHLDWLGRGKYSASEFTWPEYVAVSATVQKYKAPTYATWLNFLHESVCLDEVSSDGLIGALASMCKSLGIDLMPALTAKIEYNAKRPYRHGGKKA
jgi:hypothetical protein